MPALAYARGAYKRADLPELRVVNQYVEATPANPGDSVVLLPRPGLVQDQVIGGGPIRGMLAQPGLFNGDVFAVSGGELYRSAGMIGFIGGSGRVSMAATTNAILVGTGAGLHHSNGTTTTTVAFPDAAGVTTVGYMAGYSLAVRVSSNDIYFTLDPLVWDALDYFGAEQDTGHVVGAVVLSDQLWVFCERTTEVFNSTADADAPFQRVEGRVYDKGCIARDTLAKADNTVFWVGNDRIVYRADSTPVRISNGGIEERLADSDAADLSAWVFIWNGHTFYVLRTSVGTFAFDAATQEWCEFASLGSTNWRAQVGVFSDGASIAGDDVQGILWRFDGDVLTDNGGAIERRFTALLAGTGVIADNILLDASTGMAPTYTTTPVIEMRQSRDGGNTWGDWRGVTLGVRGDYRARPVWRRCGLIDELTVFEFRLTDQSPLRLSSVRANDGLAGRSR